MEFNLVNALAHCGHGITTHSIPDSSAESGRNTFFSSLILRHLPFLEAANRATMVLSKKSSNKEIVMFVTLNCLDFPDPEKNYQPEFSMIQGETLQTKRVHLDNYQYKNCRFVNCTFVYSGGPFGILDCQIEGDYNLALTGPARRTREISQVFVEYASTRPKLHC